MDFIFDQMVGSGANAFVIVIAIVVGFVSAVSFNDSRKTFKENDENAPFKD